MSQPLPEKAPYSDTWVVLPTYNEADNLRGISAAILEKLPGATLLVVDDNSPDGTGRIADELAAANDQVRVLHRPRKQGLGRAYIQGFGVALGSPARRIVQMDADWSHHPDHLPSLMAALEGGPGTPRPDGADIVIGSRYVRGGGVREWGLGRRLLSRAGSAFGRLVLRLGPHDLTGAYKVWRREMLARMPWHAVHSGGYVFNIECSYLADRLGARIAEVPIIFVDRRAGQSKMSRRIVFEALMVVLTLRWQELLGRRPEAMPDELPAHPAAAEGDGTSPA